jgi:hypothetical protein
MLVFHLECSFFSTEEQQQQKLLSSKVPRRKIHYISSFASRELETIRVSGGESAIEVRKKSKFV